jgi:hypothetical protein
VYGDLRKPQKALMLGIAKQSGSAATKQADYDTAGQLHPIALGG